MPHYDYICETCRHEFEIFQSMLDEPIRECPECGKIVKRVITGGTGVIFKGSGFYRTDNKKTGKAGVNSGKDATITAEPPGKEKIEKKVNPSKSDSKKESKKEK